MTTLDVYYLNHLAGHLHQAGGLHFRYTPTWLADPDFVPLSPALPASSEEFGQEVATPFFENLLPEGAMRSAIARLRQVSEGNVFGLLAELGGECAGAISVLPAGQTPQQKIGYLEISKADLATYIANSRQTPLMVAEQEMRLSLAGAQQKLALKQEGARFFLPLGDSPSTHILKPPIEALPAIPHSVINEGFCMRLAGACGLNVAHTEILREPEALLIQRYDRQTQPDGKLTRLHQLDFCQALSIPPAQKYQKEGGPSLAQCFNLLDRESTRPAADKVQLLRWVAFNYLIGNNDAHGKNLSLLYAGSKQSLAPFYDLMSTAVYDQLTGKMAMSLGGEYRLAWIMHRHWMRFAEETGIKPAFLLHTLREVAAEISAATEKLIQETAADNTERKFLQKIAAVVARQTKKLAAG